MFKHPILQQSLIVNITIKNRGHAKKKKTPMHQFAKVIFESQIVFVHLF